MLSCVSYKNTHFVSYFYKVYKKLINYFLYIYFFSVYKNVSWILSKKQRKASKKGL